MYENVRICTNDIFFQKYKTVTIPVLLCICVSHFSCTPLWVSGDGTVPRGQGGITWQLSPSGWGGVGWGGLFCAGQKMKGVCVCVCVCLCAGPFASLHSMQALIYLAHCPAPRAVWGLHTMRHYFLLLTLLAVMGPASAVINSVSHVDCEQFASGTRAPANCALRGASILRINGPSGTFSPDR